MKKEKYRTRIEKLFKDYEIHNYRECLERGWLEFNFHYGDEILCNQVDLKTLAQLGKLCNTADVKSNGWSHVTCIKPYEGEPEYEHEGYILVENIQ